MPVVRMQMQLNTTLKPDPSGRITLLLTGFVEAPLIQIHRSVDGAITRAIATQFPQFEKDADFLKTTCVYGYRMIAESLTAENSTAVVSISGQVESALVRPNYDFKQVNYPDNAPQHVWTIDRPPLDNKELASSQPSYYSGLAAEGVYQTNRLYDVFAPFTFRDKDSAKAYYHRYENADSSVLNPTAYRHGTLLALATDTIAMLPVEKQTSTAATPTTITTDENGTFVNHVAVSDPTNMQINMSYFSGLSPDATFRVKLVCDLEFLVKPGSSLWTTSTQMPPLNLQTVLSYSAASYSSPSSGPARANAFGDFLKGLSNIFDTIAPIATTVVKSIPDPRAQAAGQVLDLVSALKSASFANPSKTSNPDKGRARPTQQSPPATSSTAIYKALGGPSRPAVAARR